MYIYIIYIYIISQAFGRMPPTRFIHDTKMKKHSCKQIVKDDSKLTSKSIQKEGSGASFWGVGEVILESFWGSGRALAPKCVLGGVWGGSWAI